MGFIEWVTICAIIWVAITPFNKTKKRVDRESRKPKTNNSYRYFGIKKK